MELAQRYLDNCKLFSDRIEFLKAIPKCGIMAEIGVDQGEYSQHILDICQPKKLFLIDSWNSKRYNKLKQQSVINKFKSNDNVEILIGNSTNILNDFTDNSLDFVYIDTVHDFSHTHNELILCSKKVKSDGLICGHDYTQGNVNKRLEYGVVKAINKFCIDYDYEFIYLTNDFNRHLTFALRKMK